MKRFLLLCILLLAACAPQQETTPTYNPPSTAPPAESTEGRVVFAIADAAADMGTVTAVKVTVDSVSVRSTTEGWVTVSTEPSTYDLLQLRAEGAQALLADVNLAPGTYGEMRLDISSVVVTDDKGDHEAKLPSGELKLKGDLVVEANSTSTAVFDFIVNESLHLTGEGTYILAPVVDVETRSKAEVSINAGKRLEVKGGNVKTKVKVGMDLTGKVDVGLRIPAKARLKIGATGLISEDETTETNASVKGKGKVSVEI